MVRLGPDEAGTGGEVVSGRLALDGNRLVPTDGELVRGRIRALYNGSAVLSAVLDDDGEWAAEPELTTIGVLEADEDAIAEAVRA